MRTSSLAAALTLVTCIACGSKFPSPPLAPPLRETYLQVPYPPPPGRLDYVPKKPRSDAYWIDGQWTWLAQRWVWTAGGWIVVPPGVRFSPWRLVRRDDGDLFFSPPQWIDAQGKAAPAPPILALATSTATMPLEPEKVSNENPVHGPDMPGQGAKGSQPAPASRQQQNESTGGAHGS